MQLTSQQLALHLHIEGRKDCLAVTSTPQREDNGRVQSSTRHEDVQTIDLQISDLIRQRHRKRTYPKGQDSGAVRKRTQHGGASGGRWDTCTEAEAEKRKARS